MDKTKFEPQNPYALFSPDQWMNQFSTFNNKALPWPSTYAGVPTDAMGNPIQSFVDWQNANPAGTTINSTPAAAAPAQQSGLPSLATMNSGQRANALAGLQPSGQPYATGSGGNAATDALMNRQFAAFGSGVPQQAAAAASQPAGPPPPPNNWQATLNALSNPGKVTTPGATVPESASTQPGPGALQAFLQNWRPAQSGPGSGFQQSFGGMLNQMQAGGGGGGMAGPAGGGTRIPLDIGAALSGFPPGGFAQLRGY